MSNEVSKKEYLKRYLEKEKDLNRKRKKKHKKLNVPSLKIVDKDIDLKSLNFGDRVEEDDDDESPVIAEIIDERPMEEKVKELYESSRWKKVDHDGISTFNSVMPYKENESKKSKLNSISLKEKSIFGNNSFPKKGQSSSKKARHDSDSDMSPPRNQERISRRGHDSSNQSSQRDQKRNHSDSDISPPRSHKVRRNRNNHDSDSDISSPCHQLFNKSNASMRQKSKRHDSDSDISPPRHQTSVMSALQIKHKSKKCNSDSDISPPRHQIVNKANSQIKKSSERHDSDSDHISSKNENNSHAKVKYKSSNLKDYKQKNSDSDMSPPRSSELSSAKDKGKKLDKTLSGLKAGLQNSKTLQKELQKLREKEKNQLNSLDDEISGRNADTIIRDRKTGLKRDLDQEQQVKNKEEKKVKEYQQKYTEWGRGVEQTLDKKEKLKDDIYEMSKPLARYQDDKDLDERLKSIIHDDDPMSEYIKKKRQKDVPNLPAYSGPPAPPNRFGILPGYRWDGVDRSNGFEKKYFEKINKSKAIESEAYLWSVQDM